MSCCCIIFGFGFVFVSRDECGGGGERRRVGELENNADHEEGLEVSGTENRPWEMSSETMFELAVGRSRGVQMEQARHPASNNRKSV
jgi:hypothetical protein